MSATKCTFCRMRAHGHGKIMGSMGGDTAMIATIHQTVEPDGGWRFTVACEGHQSDFSVAYCPMCGIQLDTNEATA